MIAYLVLVVLLVAILALVIYGLFIKPYCDKRFKPDYAYTFEDDDEYDGDYDSGVAYYEDFEIEEEELPSSPGRSKPAEDVSLSKSSTGQILLRIKSTTSIPELFPVSEGDKIILKIDSNGFRVDYYPVE